MTAFGTILNYKIDLHVHHHGSPKEATVGSSLVVFLLQVRRQAGGLTSVQLDLLSFYGTDVIVLRPRSA